MVLLLKLINSIISGANMSAPYVDAYGETDDGLTRGNPLKLDRAMFENLRQIWFNHDIPTKVTSSYDRESIVFGNMWFTL
jgi:E3 ubiquitin-protein ligase UBR1